MKKVVMALAAWLVVAIVLGIAGNEAFAFWMGCVVGAVCLVMAVLACAVGPGGIPPEAGKREEEKDAPAWMVKPDRVDVVG